MHASSVDQGIKLDRRQEIARLLALVEAYSAALNELQSLDDPAVAELIVETIALRERAAEEAEHLMWLLEAEQEESAP